MSEANTILNIVMEFCDSIDLLAMIKQKKAADQVFPEDDIWNFAL